MWFYFPSVSFMKERLDQDSVGIILLHNFLTEFFPGEVCGALKWLINVWPTGIMIHVAWYVMHGEWCMMHGPFKDFKYTLKNFWTLLPHLSPMFRAIKVKLWMHKSIVLEYCLCYICLQDMLADDVKPFKAFHYNGLGLREEDGTKKVVVINFV